LRSLKKADAVIVFIHGVFGSESTWRNPGAKMSWPELIANDPEFASADIFLANYGSPYLRQSSNIEEIAQRLLQQFSDNGVFNHTRIYFIVHSMGGLIAKRILTSLNTPSRVGDLRRVRAILYLSTPAQGAPTADIAAFITMNPQLKDMEPADLNTFLQTLENSWNDLLRERDRVREVYPRAFCAYETLPTAGIRIVNRVYSNSRCDNNPYAMDFDHSDIVKPIDDKTDPYAWAKARIGESDRLGTLLARAESDSLPPEELARIQSDARKNPELGAALFAVIGDGRWKASENISSNFGEARRRAVLVEAVRAYTEAARLNPTSPVYSAKLASTLSSAGNSDAAIRNFQRAIVLDPTIAWYHSELCSTYSKAGDAAQALHACQAAIRLQPTNPEHQLRMETAASKGESSVTKG
jgi:pimeloyl-ACP methyl ester carboxylesterase